MLGTVQVQQLAREIVRRKFTLAPPSQARNLADVFAMVRQFVSNRERQRLAEVGGSHRFGYPPVDANYETAGVVFGASLGHAPIA